MPLKCAPCLLPGLPFPPGTGPKRNENNTLMSLKNGA